MPVRTRTILLAGLALLLLGAGPAHAAGSARTAALQEALRERGLYAGPLDGIAGPETSAAVRAVQRRVHLTPDGVAGPQTRRALRLRELGRRPLRLGASGSDVLELQWELAWHGFPSGALDGGFGLHTERAVRRFQRWARLGADGVAGPATIAALRAPPPRSPLALARPIAATPTDRFGPRGVRFHSGVDFPAPTGTGIAAAAPGRVADAGWLDGGWGELVVVAHADGLRTFYAHLSRIEVRLGERVQAGFEVGRVGATGDATGPHLHFEVRHDGRPIDPAPLLPLNSSSVRTTR